MEIKFKYIIKSLSIILFIITHYFIINEIYQYKILNKPSNDAILTISFLLGIIDGFIIIYIINLLFDYCDKNWNKTFKIKL